MSFQEHWWLPQHRRSRFSSGFRLYRADALKRISFRASDFDVLEEILILIYIAGGSVTEVPFLYRPRQAGRSHAKLFKFGVAYARTFYAMWKLRRSRRA